jgi:hypothetical protein
VAADYKDTVLLMLIQDYIRDDIAFRNWLEEKGIPFQTSMWP